MTERQSRISLYWIPLGAGGVGFVRFNGRLYEAIQARRQGRTALELFHTALEVHTADGRFIVENAWPSPDADIGSRGVALEGPVFSRRLERLRPFRYEVRVWRDGVIADASAAVQSPLVLSHDPGEAQRLVDSVGSVPAYVWGRDELGAGEMWNSNSVVSWLLTRVGLMMEGIQPPDRGRAPGWRAGVLAAQNEVNNKSNHI
jgi:hypothetical protein